LRICDRSPYNGWLTLPVFGHKFIGRHSAKNVLGA